MPGESLGFNPEEVMSEQEYNERAQEAKELLEKDFKAFEESLYDDLRDLSDENPADILKALRGNNSDQAYEIREKVLENNPEIIDAIATQMYGLDDQKAWELRNKIAEKSPLSLLVSLKGIDTDKAWEIRESFLDKNPEKVIISLEGVDSEKAWNIREKSVNEYPRIVLGSLSGMKNDRARSLRGRCYNIARSMDLPVLVSEEDFIAKMAGSSLLSEIKGNNDEESFEARFNYLDENPVAVAGSLKGLDSGRANKMREYMANENFIRRFPKGDRQKLIDAVAASLEGCESDESYNFRERLLDLAPAGAAESLNGISSEKSLELRKKIKEKNKKNPSVLGKLLKSILGLK